MVAPHIRHVVTFSDNIDVSNDFLSSNDIGEGNSALHFVQTTKVSGIFLPPWVLFLIFKSINRYICIP